LHNPIQSVPVTLFVYVSVRCLDVSMSGLPAGAHITDDGLVPVISRCHQLTTLSISRLSLVCMPRQATPGRLSLYVTTRSTGSKMLCCCRDRDPLTLVAVFAQNSREKRKPVWNQ